MTDFDFSSHKLDKKTFYSYCLFIQRERRYKSNWAFVMVKSCFGEWVEKPLKAEAQAEKPTPEFYTWLDDYIKNAPRTQYEHLPEPLPPPVVKTIVKKPPIKPSKPRKLKKPPTHDIDCQMREVGEILAIKGKDFTTVTQDELNRELRNWHINEHYKKKTAQMTEEEQLIDLLFFK